MVQSSRGNYFRPVTSAYLYVLLFCGVSLVRFPGRLLGGSAGSPGALQQSTPMSPVGSIRRAFSWELFHRTPCHVQGGEGSSLCYLINLIKLVNFWGEEITSKIIAIALQKKTSTSSKFRCNRQETVLASSVAGENIFCDSFHFHLLDKMQQLKF